MYHDDKEVVMLALTQHRNPEDEAYSKLVVEQLVYVINDFKDFMDIYNTYGDSNRSESNRIITRLIPTIIFFKSPYCEACCEFINLGDKSSSYDLFKKVDGVYNVKKYDYNLKRYYATKKAMVNNLHATLKAFDLSIYSFCRKIGVSPSSLSQMIYTFKNSNAKVPRKPVIELTDDIYRKVLRELKYLFNTYELGFMFTPEEWGVL